MAGPFAKRKRLVGGPVSQLVVTGAYSGGERLGARPPWIFRILRERALSLTTAIEKETKRKKVREKEEIYRFWSYDGQRNPIFSNTSSSL